VNLKWKESTGKDFRKIDPQHIPEIIKVAETLAKNPYPHGSRKFRDAKKKYRIRVGDYRVIYSVENQKKR